MPTIAQVRERYGAAVDGYTDQQLADILQQAFAPDTKDPSAYKKRIGYDEGSNFTRGLGIAGRNTIASVAGAGALAADAVGAESVRDYALEFARKQQTRAAQMGRTYDDVDNFSENPMGFLAAGAGQAVGYAAPSLLSGGVGALGARVLGARALTGAAAGSFAANYAQEAGGIYNDLAEQGRYEPGRAAVFGAGAAALDTGAEAVPFLRGSLRGGIGRRLLTGIPTQAAAEAGTEVAQSAIERAGAYKDVTGDEAMREYRNAAALGAIGGGMFGGLSAIPSADRAQEAQLRLIQAQREADAQRQVAEEANRRQDLLNSAYVPQLGEQQEMFGAAPLAPDAQQEQVPYEDLKQRQATAQRLLNQVRREMDVVETTYNATGDEEAFRASQQYLVPRYYAILQEAEFVDQQVANWEYGQGNRDAAIGDVGGQQKFDFGPGPQGPMPFQQLDLLSSRPSLVTGEDINRNLGLSFNDNNVAQRQADFEAALAEGTNAYAVEPQQGYERQLNAGELFLGPPDATAVQNGPKPQAPTKPTYPPELVARSKQLLGKSSDKAVQIMGKLDEALAAGRVTPEDHAMHANNIHQARSGRAMVAAYKAAEVASTGTNRTGEGPAAAVQPTQGAGDVGVSALAGQPAGTGSGVGGAVQQGSVADPGRNPAPANGVPAASAVVGPNDAAPPAGGIGAQGRAPAVAPRTGKLLDRIKGKTVVIGGAVDFNQLKQVLEPEDPRLHHAVRLILGIDSQGNRLDKPLTAEEASVKAYGDGSNQGANIRRTANALGITREVRNRFAASEAMANERAEGVGDEVAAPEERGAALSEERTDSGDREPTWAEAGYGTVSSAGGAQSRVETERAGSIADQGWYKKAAPQLEKMSGRDLVGLVIRASTFKDSPQNKAALRQLTAALKGKPVTQADYNAAMRQVMLESQKAGGEYGIGEDADAMGEVDGQGDEATELGARPETTREPAPSREAAKAAPAGKQARVVKGFGDRLTKDVRKRGENYTLERHETTEVDQADFLQYPALNAAQDHLDSLGIGHVGDWVGEWRLVDDEAAADGWLENLGSRYSLTLNVRASKSANGMALTYTHELAHAADMAGHNGVYSRQPEIDVGGDVYNEIHALQAKGDFWGAFFQYPFDRQHYGIRDDGEFRQELFAQLFAAYTHQKVRPLMERDAPLAAAFMKDVVNDLKATQARQIQTYGEAAARATAFRNRDSGPGPGTQLAQGAQGSGAEVPRGADRRAEQRLSQGVDQRGEAVDSLPEAVRPAAKSVSRTLSRWGREALNHFTFTEDLLNRAKGLGLKSAETYKNLARQKAAYIGHHERSVLEVLSTYRDLPSNLQGKGEGTVNDYLYNSTLQRKWGYQPSWLSDSVDIDPETQKAYEALGPEGQKFVDQAFRIGADTLAKKKAEVLSATATEYDVMLQAARKANDADLVAELEAEKADAMKKFGSLLSISGKEPYSPIKRFGNWVVIAKSTEYQAAEKAEDTAKMRELEKQQAHYYVDFAETEGEADKIRDSLRAEGGYSSVVGRAREDMRDKLYGGSKTLAALSKLRGRVDMLPAEDKATAKKLRELLTDMYLLQLAEDSSRKSEMRRRGIAGDIDMIRSLEAQGKADAGFLGSVKYGEPMLNAINDMRREMRESPDDSQKPQSETFNEVLRRHLQGMDYKPTPWADKLVRAPSLWFLATSPSYYIQNATQPWTMSLPVMAGRHEIGKSAGALLRAYNDVAPAMKSAKVFDNINFSRLLEGTELTADEKTMLQALLDQGRIDIGVATELGDSRATESGAGSKAWQKVDRGLRGLQMKMESLNRLTTALAAYRLELSQTKDAAKATAYADEVIRQTHGDYSAWNAPRAFNTGPGKVALQFRKFQLIQLTLLAKLVKNSFGDAPPAEKAIARRALAFTLGQAMILGGGKALPIPFALAWLFAKAFGDGADEPPEYVLRKMIGDKDISDLLINGLPAALLGFNGSSLGGFNNTVSAFPFTDIDFGDRDKVAGAGFAMLAGPLGGLSLRAADGINQIEGGNYYKGLAGLLPKGFSNILKAVDTSTKGVYQKDGDVTMSPDEISFFDTAQQAVGFTPQAQLDRVGRQQAAYRIEQSMKDQSARIKTEYTQAAKAGDRAAMREAQDEWMQYQAKRREFGFKPQPLSALLQAPRLQAKRERGTVGNVQTNSGNADFAEQLANE